MREVGIQLRIPWCDDEKLPDVMGLQLLNAQAPPLEQDATTGYIPRESLDWRVQFN